MAKNSVLDESYEQLQKDIQTLHTKWCEQVAKVEISGLGDGIEKKSPLIPQLNLTIDISQYHLFIEQLLDLISLDKVEISITAKRLKELLTTEVLEKWFDETISVNQFYFAKFSEDHELPEWLPFFVAEYAARPYLQKATEELAEHLKGIKNIHACPCCGEPARFALVGKQGGKVMNCPRCLHTWDEKKISCAHCGAEGDLVILKVEGEETAEVHACNKCKGYTKVIDTRKLFKQESPTLLDVKNIHLDYIAQEKGYGIPEESEAH